MSKEKLKAHEKDYGNAIVNNLRNYLWEIGRANSTIDNYCRTATQFLEFACIATEEEMITLAKTVVRNFVEHMNNSTYEDDKKYVVETINNKIAGLNQLLELYKLNSFKEKALYCHRKTFIEDTEILTDDDVSRILKESKKSNYVLYLAVKSMTQMGLRVSEIQFITVESLNRGYILVLNKGGARKVPLPLDLIKELRAYCIENAITRGIIISARNNIAINRSTVGRLMKKLAEKIGIDTKKAHPHSLRHNFAIRYLRIYGQGAISHLADILGHRSVETTRIYLRDTLTNAAKSLTAKNLNIK